MELEKSWLYVTVLKIPFFTQEIFSKGYDDFCLSEYSWDIY